MQWSRYWAPGLFGILVFWAFSAPLGAATAQAHEPPRTGEQTIRLGASLPLSGRFSQNGRYLRDGYTFAVEVINRRGGIAVGEQSMQFELVYADDTSEASRAAAIIEGMVSERKIQFLLGTYSTQLAQALEPIAERHQVPMIEAGAAGSSLFERGYRHLFGLLTTTDHYMDDLFTIAEREAAPKLGKKVEDISVGLAVHDDRFGQDIRKEVLSEVSKHNMRLVIDDRLPRDPTDMSMTLDRVRLLEPDVMVISGHERAAVAALGHLHQRGVSIPMLALTHCRPANIVERNLQGSEGVFCPMQWHPKVPYRDEVFGSAQDYADKFEERFGYAPPYLAAQASAAVLVYAKAIDQCDSTAPAIVRKTLADLETQTFYGPIDFDKAGRNSAKPMLLMQVIDGEYVMIAPGKYGGAKPVIRRHRDR